MWGWGPAVLKKQVDEVANGRAQPFQGCSLLSSKC